ncbi:hypothetical protein V8E53_006794, partial [Lactarius tabidus]
HDFAVKVPIILQLLLTFVFSLQHYPNIPCFPFNLQEALNPSQSSGSQTHTTKLCHAMHASRAFIAMLVLVASAVVPVLSIPIELEPRDCADVGGGIRQYGACKRKA